ncbi:biotin--[acetyl-CoA-carboxylase] ligase [Polaribacter vadi]|uniref:biotin--[acetyl-CoA-carboxylase] ligase n=1 Tax=Polaribacter TaxID=52959 RepID=UPI001C092020|nr:MULTISPECIES: biotin--[acetyl-CoA-carboxylase] ligase [Polaribacter]MBU3012920.1 biotin--[acetyl-CoA-carboxylase] ligase [Polaribacter vadi]MDO6742738.1 biotin--[acetyl-CoA-carboxylase] ligase [Polaribacter sp. 1_MG-2023]
MKIIKLSAIDSTNSFLKELSQKSAIDNFTVVVTDKQTKGRGQQANTWISEPYKNLTTSIFITNFDLEIYHQKYLNFAISLAIFDVLFANNIKALSIKWPNDIMSANKKICGILIENNIRKNKIYSSIIGLGLNVNQESYPDYLEKASSLKMITNINYNLDDLLLELINYLKERVNQLNLKNYRKLESDYLNVLYKKETPSMFKDKNGVLFMGKITGISSFGNLLVEVEDETIKEFGIKEISFV